MMAISNTVLLVILIITFVLILGIFFLVGFCFASWCPFLCICSKRRKARVALKNILMNRSSSSNLVSQPCKRLNDLENQPVAIERNTDSASNIALKSYPMDSNHSAKICNATQSQICDGNSPNVDETHDLDFKSVLDNFDKSESCISHNFVEESRNESDLMPTLIAHPSQNAESIVQSEFDTFSLTLLLQYLIQTSTKPDDQAIRKVSDPFLDNYISVGEKVVIVKSFIGKTDTEFPSLQTGDLLRIIKFIVRDSDDSDEATGSIKSMRMAPKSPTRPRPRSRNQKQKQKQDYQPTSAITLESSNESFSSEIIIDKSDPIHKNIYCVGLLLNSYLDFNNDQLNLKLKVQETSSEEEEEATEDLIKEFPLSIVSLETTVVKSVLAGEVGEEEEEEEQAQMN